MLKSINLTEQALEEVSAATPVAPDRTTLIFRGAALICLGMNHRELGHLDKAKQLLEEAAKLKREAGNYYAALASLEQLAKLAVIREQPQQALDLYRSGLKLSQDWKDTRGKPQRSLIAAAGSHLGLGMVLYQLNDLAGAATHIQRGVDLLELGEFKGGMHSYTMLAYLKQAQGELQPAVELFRKACAIEDTIMVRRSNISALQRLAQLGILLSRLGPEMAHLLEDARRRVANLGVQANDEVGFSSPAE